MPNRVSFAYMRTDRQTRSEQDSDGSNTPSQNALLANESLQAVRPSGVIISYRELEPGARWLGVIAYHSLSVPNCVAASPTCRSCLRFQGTTVGPTIPRRVAQSALCDVVPTQASQRPPRGKFRIRVGAVVERRHRSLVTDADNSLNAGTWDKICQCSG